ncbi:hypothetical protein B0H10DRAFT_1212140 [Mycena sp. CBHHK59/15]|nr:hypothetical protein B0H10DRAFT_1212140 [Mycena sp. CBHHK59/15]
MAEPSPTHLTKLDAYSNLEDIDDAAEALGLVVTTFLADDVLPLDPLYTNAEPCMRLLKRQADLHDVLKVAHVSKDFSAIRNHAAALHRQEKSRSITEYLATLRPIIIQFMNQGGIPAWEPSPEIVADPELRKHVASLGIPSVQGLPNVLVRGLGSFADDTILSSRVKNIFRKGQHTFLVNASGTGKTRLIFEGLCQNWGFYFVAVVDSMSTGSPDVFRVLKTYIPKSRPLSFWEYIPTPSFHDFPRRLADNKKKLHRYFRDVLLSRLLVFSVFLEHAHSVGICAQHKKLWLMVQALPHVVDRSGDVFNGMLMLVVHTNESYVEDYISYLLGNFRGLLGEDFHMFFVLDEAQSAFRHFPTAFRDDDGTLYPALREILDCWEGQFLPDETSFVTVGTDIPKVGFQNSRHASRHRWCSDTGTFDDLTLHQQYVSSFLPPSYVASEAGKHFLQMTWDWCRGRHRFTDSLMATLTRDGFQSPHTLLNDYVQKSTGFRPTDNLEYVQAERCERVEIWIQRINCRIIDSPSYKLIKSSLQDMLFHSLLASNHRVTFKDDHIQVVSQGFGRFIDPSMSEIRIDEPLMLVAAAMWFFRPPDETSDDSPYSYLDVLEQYSPTASHTFAKVLADHLCRAFGEGHPVSRVFSFPYAPVPKWAKQTAEIVTLHQHNGHLVQYAPTAYSSLSTPLASAPTSLDDTIAWLSHQDPQCAPFCLPVSGTPDLICVLRLKDGSFVRLILQAVATSSLLQGSELRDIIKTMSTGHLFVPERFRNHRSSNRAGSSA